MSARGRMTHRAEQRRPDNPAENAWGQPGIHSYTVIESSLPCWVWEERREFVDSEEKLSFLSTHRGMFQKSADLKEDDQVGEIKDRRGNQVHAGVLRVRTIRPTATFLDVVLERVDGG